ncbi:hypothetical protein [Fusobacterium sp. PH5-44]|uniref:hypothetical protein n=1 Tax=unclassified Fusobacterium TaxID=2648384 RepID=UPI003D2300E0
MHKTLSKFFILILSFFIIVEVINADSLTTTGGAPIPKNMVFEKGGTDVGWNIKSIKVGVTGRVSRAEKLWIYYSDYISKTPEFTANLKKIPTVNNAEKEKIMSAMSKGFTNKWKDNGIKIVISNSYDKSFKRAIRKSMIYYNAKKHIMYFNEDLFDFTDETSIIEAIGYANYDHLIFCNKEEVKKWSFADIEKYYESLRKK